MQAHSTLRNAAQKDLESHHHIQISRTTEFWLLIIHDITVSDVNFINLLIYKFIVNLQLLNEV